MINKHIKILSASFTLGLLFLSGCSVQKTSQQESKYTKHPNNACLMLRENRDWLHATYNTYKTWNIPISVQLAIIRHESSFDPYARPIRKNKWYETGTNYASSALGYSQALNGTWGDYLKFKKISYNDASRSSFKDSTDFIGWYSHNVYNSLKIEKRDAYNLYLAYHEGIGGYRRGSYNQKPWLINYAKRVANTSVMYSKQLNNCDLRL